MQPSQIRVFDGLRITTEHVDHLQGALHSALRDLRAIAGAGVHRGLGVTIGPDNVATIDTGMAIDGAGNRLVCDDPLSVPIGVLAADEPRYVCLRYDRVENREVEGRPTFVWDSCAAEVRPGAPKPEDNLVVLARVVGNAGGGARVEPAVATAPSAETEPQEVSGGLGLVQGLLRMDGAEAEILPRLTDAIRARTVQGDPLVVPLHRRDVALEAEVMSLSCSGVLSAAFTAPAPADIQPVGFRCHASASGEATFAGEAIAQWALSTTYDTDRGVSRPSLGDGLVASLEPALVAGAADSGSLPDLLAPLELRVRIERLEAGDGFAAACELVWSGETGEAAALAVQAGLASAHWEFSLAWKALAVSSLVAPQPGS
jgi:hypothetical protein